MMLWAVATVFFFCRRHLALEDMAYQWPTTADLFHKRVDIVLGATGNKLCLVKAFFDYQNLWMRGGIPDLLLVMRDRSSLTHSHFVTRVRTALTALGYTNSGQFSGHSFQVGAATTAAAMKVEESIIKTLGRWESAAYLLYVRIPREELEGISSILSKFGKTAWIVHVCSH